MKLDWYIIDGEALWHYSGKCGIRVRPFMETTLLEQFILLKIEYLEHRWGWGSKIKQNKNKETKAFCMRK